MNMVFGYTYFSDWILAKRRSGGKRSFMGWDNMEYNLTTVAIG